MTTIPSGKIDFIQAVNVACPAYGQPVTLPRIAGEGPAASRGDHPSVTWAPSGPRQPATIITDLATALAYTGAAPVGVRGIAHALPTRQVLASFEPTAANNRRIIFAGMAGRSLHHVGPWPP